MALIRAQVQPTAEHAADSAVRDRPFILAPVSAVQAFDHISDGNNRDLIKAIKGLKVFALGAALDGKLVTIDAEDVE